MKSLGQLCHEGRGNLTAGSMIFAVPMAWEKLSPTERADLERIRQWDALGIQGSDGPFWQREIDAVLRHYDPTCSRRK